MTILNILKFGEVITPKYEALHPGLVILENSATLDDHIFPRAHK